MIVGLWCRHLFWLPPLWCILHPSRFATRLLSKRGSPKQILQHNIGREEVLLPAALLFSPSLPAGDSASVLGVAGLWVHSFDSPDGFDDEPSDLEELEQFPDHEANEQALSLIPFSVA